LIAYITNSARYSVAGKFCCRHCARYSSRVWACANVHI